MNRKILAEIVATAKSFIVRQMEVRLQAMQSVSDLQASLSLARRRLANLNEEDANPFADFTGIR